jgi:hypothetical protein
MNYIIVCLSTIVIYIAIKGIKVINNKYILLNDPEEYNQKFIKDSDIIIIKFALLSIILLILAIFLTLDKIKDEIVYNNTIEETINEVQNGRSD